MDLSDDSPDPTKWPLDRLFQWLSQSAIPNIRSNLSSAPSKSTPTDGELTSTIFELAKSTPQLCGGHHQELFKTVAKRFITKSKRIAPIPVLTDVTPNEAFSHVSDPSRSDTTLPHLDQLVAGEAVEIEEDRFDVISELAFDYAGLPEHDRFMDTKLTYTRMLDELRENSRYFEFDYGRPARLNNFVEDEDDEVIDFGNDDDDLSDHSITYLRELEEELVPVRSHVPQRSIDIAMIVTEETDKLIAKWKSRRLPICKTKAFGLWHKTTNGPYGRARAVKDRETRAEHLATRLLNFQNKIKEQCASTRKETEVRHLCGILEQTVFDHQKALFEIEMLSQSSPPEKVAVHRRKTKPFSVPSESDAVSVDSESEAESEEDDAPIILKSDLFAMPTIQRPESKGKMLDIISISSDSDDDISREVREDSKENEANGQTPSSARRGRITNIDVLLSSSPSSSDESMALPKIVDKRMKAVKQSKQSQRAQQDAVRRAEEDEARAIQNSQQTWGQGQIPINPGKKDDQEFIFMNELACSRLQQHQIDGIQFLWREVVTEMDESKATGCLLSHTMGLGKTMQAITLLATISEASQSQDENISSQIPESLRLMRTLILCPPGLIANWDEELKKWLPHRKALGKIFLLLSGEAQHTQKIKDWSNNGGVLVIGHALFRRIVSLESKKGKGKKGTEETLEAQNKENPQEQEEREDIRNLLLQQSSMVIADEAHLFKNQKSLLRRSATLFKTKRRIALTGSPLSNSVREYWSMIDWVAPGYLGSEKEFQDVFESPILEGGYLESTVEQQRDARIALEALERVLKPKVHRRDATTVKDTLPRKQEYIIKLQLTWDQLEIYKEYVKLLFQTRSKKFQMGDVLNHGRVLTWIAGHPEIFSRHIFQREHDREKEQENGKKGRDGGPETGYVNLDEKDLHELAVKAEHISERANSIKSRCFLEIVKGAWAKGDKTLLFSQSIKTLDFLHDLLSEHNIESEILNGSTDMKKRLPMLHHFNDSSSRKAVLLISTRAGNVGFNIHGANRVVIFDFDWNPTYEEQAIGRAYRLGQQKQVYVYRLVSDGTFESILLEETTRKMQLTCRVLDKQQMQNMPAKRFQKYLGPPTDPPALEQVGFEHEDDILGKLIAMHDESPFITGLFDAEQFRAGCEPPPLTKEHEDEVNRKVEKARQGDWKTMVNDARSSSSAAQQQLFAEAAVRRGSQNYNIASMVPSSSRDGLASQSVAPAQPLAAAFTAVTKAFSPSRIAPRPTAEFWSATGLGASPALRAQNGSNIKQPIGFYPQIEPQGETMQAGAGELARKSIAEQRPLQPWQRSPAGSQSTDHNSTNAREGEGEMELMRPRKHARYSSQSGRAPTMAPEDAQTRADIEAMQSSAATMGRQLSQNKSDSIPGGSANAMGPPQLYASQPLAFNPQLMAALRAHHQAYSPQTASRLHAILGGPAQVLNRQDVEMMMARQHQALQAQQQNQQRNSSFYSPLHSAYASPQFTESDRNVLTQQQMLILQKVQQARQLYQQRSSQASSPVHSTSASPRLVANPEEMANLAALQQHVHQAQQQAHHQAQQHAQQHVSPVLQTSGLVGLPGGSWSPPALVTTSPNFPSTPQTPIFQGQFPGFGCGPEAMTTRPDFVPKSDGTYDLVQGHAPQQAFAPNPSGMLINSNASGPRRASHPLQLASQASPLVPYQVGLQGLPRDHPRGHFQFEGGDPNVETTQGGSTAPNEGSANQDGTGPQDGYWSQQRSSNWKY